MTRTIDHAQAVEIDTQLAELANELCTIQDRLTRTTDDCHYAANERPHKVNRSTGRKTWLRRDEETIQIIRELASGNEVASRRRDLPALIARLDDLTAQRTVVTDKMAALETVFQANPWPRFFLVQNNGGHIHSSTRCQTCRFTTRFGWLPELSGLTEADAVAAHGAILCTVCYPSAPLEWTRGKDADPNTCPKAAPVEGTRKWYGQRRCGACPTCGSMETINDDGTLRKHKRANA